MSKCFGLKNPETVGELVLQKQCTCKPKRKVDGVQLCGNHAKKANMRTVFALSASALVPKQTAGSSAAALEVELPTVLDPLLIWFVFILYEHKALPVPTASIPTTETPKHI